MTPQDFDSIRDAELNRHLDREADVDELVTPAEALRRYVTRTWATIDDEQEKDDGR